MKFIARKNTNGVYELFEVIGKIFTTKEVKVETIELPQTKSELLEYIRIFACQVILNSFDIRSYFNADNECFTCWQKNILGIWVNETSNLDDNVKYYKNKQNLINAILTRSNRYLKIEIQ